MTPWLDDGDVRLYHGDVLDVLAGLPDESVDCVVTSPPYWGLRDYGTGTWEGGDADCDHKVEADVDKKRRDEGRAQTGTFNGSRVVSELDAPRFRDVCGKCGARRVDQQIGLEPTPDQFVESLVNVFREVRRVLAAHGTCWVNLGDSYAGGKGQSGQGNSDYQAARADVSLNRPHHQLAGPGQTRALDDLAALRQAGLKPKDLVGVPWRVAFALQADGWWLRSAITWCKPNCMPESVTDRPTKATEMVFLLTQAARYYYDAEAIRTDHQRDGRAITEVVGGNGSLQHRDGERWPGTGANARDWWLIATQPYPEAHFATYPEELVRRCVLAGCPVRVCATCGKPSQRVVEVESSWRSRAENGATRGNLAPEGLVGAGTQRAVHGAGVNHDLDSRRREVVGWSDCGHNTWRVGVVLDPFVGSGTTCKVARDHGRHSIGIDLNEQYLQLAARRLQQQSLLTLDVGA